MVTKKTAAAPWEDTPVTGKAPAAAKKVAAKTSKQQDSLVSIAKVATRKTIAAGTVSLAPVAKKAADVKALPSSEAEKKELGPPPAGVKVPKTIAAAADLMKTHADEYTRLNKLAEVEDVKRKWLKAWIIQELPKQGANSIGGKTVTVSIVKKETPRAEDWGLIYGHIVAQYNQEVKKKTGNEAGAFALLQKRLGDANVKDLWDGGVVIPGVSKFTYSDLSISKV